MNTDSYMGVDYIRPNSRENTKKFIKIAIFNKWENRDLDMPITLHTPN